MKNPFLERLTTGRPLIADGALGTLLYHRGVAYDDCFEVQSLRRPELVEELHRDYIVSGAELIETNTFGANRIRLAEHGLEDQVAEINSKGARLARGAREICGEDVFVAGSVGPTGRTVQPYGSMPTTELFEVFSEQLAALLEGGIDLFVLETFGDLAEISVAIKAARAISDLPIVAQMTFADDSLTPHGHTPEQVVAGLQELDVNVIGANCSVGPTALFTIAQRLLAAGAGVVSAMPNAGWPTQVGSRVFYLSSPEYMGEYGRRMADLGVALIGGCCGTTPAHIRALKTAIETESDTSLRLEIPPAREPELDIEAAEEPSLLASKLGRGRVISVEISPPRGANPRKALQGAKLLHEAGADAVNVFDSAMSRVRMSAMSTAVLIQQQLGVETIVHFTTRDRNLMAIQSDLIGGHALGIRTILALTGDPPAVGTYAEAKAVYDVDSVGLIRIIKLLNAGMDMAGNSIGAPTRFLVGCALNPTAEDPDVELEHFRAKVAAGADFVMTQPVFDPNLFSNVLAMLGSVDLPILMGVLPLQSYRHALFLHNELPGVRLTPEALRRMELAGADGIPEGLKMAHEMIAECGALTAGIYVMPSFHRYENAAQLVSELLAPV